MRIITLLAIAIVAIVCGATLSAKPAAQPGIISHFKWLVSEPEDEWTGNLSDAWQLYQAHREQPVGTTLEFDVKNGYMRYENHSPEDDGVFYTEMCYWRCADGKHHLIAINSGSNHDGYINQGQFDGVMFYVYDVRSRTYDQVALEDYGFDPWECMVQPTSGYDAEAGAFYYEDTDGTRHYMDRQQWLEWEKNKPYTTIELPRKGKDIIVITHTSREEEVHTFTWNGSKFVKQ